MGLKQKLLSEQEILFGAILVTVLGSLIGLYLLFQSCSWLWWIGIGGVLIAITYTAGPFPLAYNGLGRGCGWCFHGTDDCLRCILCDATRYFYRKSMGTCLISFPIMFTTAAILHANNIRDLEADRAANKRTLAVIFGREMHVKNISCYWRRVTSHKFYWLSRV